MIKIETVKTDSFSMDFFKFGSGKKTLVILPGLSVQSVMMSAAAVENAYEPLSNDFTVYVFDRRKELPPVYSIDEMASDTAKAIYAAGIEKTSIFGASQGAMMAMKISASFPDLVEKLVLASAAERITDKDRVIFEKWIDLANKKDAENLYLSFGEAIYPRDIFESMRWFIIKASKTVTGNDLERFTILARAASGFDAVRELEKIKCPTLVIGDADDNIFGGEAPYRIAELMKQNQKTEIYVYSGYGHACYDTAPDFKDRILRFLNKR